MEIILHTWKKANHCDIIYFLSHKKHILHAKIANFMRTHSVYTINCDFNRWKGMFDISWVKPFTFSVFVCYKTNWMWNHRTTELSDSISLYCEEVQLCPRVLVAEIIKNHWRADRSTHLGLWFLYILDTSSAYRTASREQNCSCPCVKHSVLVVFGQMLCYSFVDYKYQFMFCCAGSGSFISNSFLLLLFF